MAEGTKITYSNGKLHVPRDPIIPFIEGDRTGGWKASKHVFDAAVDRAYQETGASSGKRRWQGGRLRRHGRLPAGRDRGVLREYIVSGP